FPPQPNSKRYMEEVAYSFCQATTPSALQEVGCGVCGMLVPKRKAVQMKKTGIDFSILAKIGLRTTRKERRDFSEKIQELEGPVIDGNCAYVCSECSRLLSKKKIPLLLLANGNWLGDVPIQLTDLSYAEKLPIARVRPNYCVARVESGMHKMHANAVLVPNPMAKIYTMLPPHRDDIEEVMAFVYTGPTHPSQEDLRITPFLVRHRKITAALEWLKLNHCDY
ncbi:hypothetical protein K439DRAFT_1309630, partial [Ramaria rubella]